MLKFSTEYFLFIIVVIACRTLVYALIKYSTHILVTVAATIVAPLFFNIRSTVVIVSCTVKGISALCSTRPVTVFVLANRPACPQYWAVRRLSRAEDYSQKLNPEYRVTAHAEVRARQRRCRQCRKPIARYTYVRYVDRQVDSVVYIYVYVSIN
jgi:hypothetical protein